MDNTECHGKVLGRFVKCPKCDEAIPIEGIIQSAQNVVEGITERDAFAEAAACFKVGDQCKLCGWVSHLTGVAHSENADDCPIAWLEARALGE